MGDRMRTVWIVLALSAGVETSATAATLAPMSSGMTTIRIEPTRPGGLPGSPREIAPLKDVDAQTTPSTKPTLKIKRRRQ